MSSPVPPTTTVLRCRPPHVEACPCPSRLFTLRAKLLAGGPDRITARECEAVLSTGDPISVVFPYATEEGVALLAEEVPYPAELAWNGIPARLIQVRLGLAVLESESPRPFRLLALLPLREVEGVPPLLRLGAEFLYAHRAEVRLTADPCEGRLLIPG